MNTLEERLRTGLAAEAQAWPGPPVPRTERRGAPSKGIGVALIAAAAVFVVIGGVTATNRILFSEPTQPDAAHLPPSTTLAGEEPAAVASDGPFEATPFTGNGWRLYVAEDDNPPLATFKVCYRFDPLGEMTEASGRGASGCSDWPTDTDRHVVDAVPVLETETGVVLFVDLTHNPVQTVIVTTDDGQRHEVKPFRMPGSGKQFVAVELPHRDGGASLEVVDEFGVVVEVGTVARLSLKEDESGRSVTTVAPVADLDEAIVEHPVTLSDGTQVTVSLLVVEGSDFPVLWGAGLSRGAYDESHEAAPFSALVHVWFYRSADDVRRGLEEAEEASGSIMLTDNRYIVDHDGHAFDFQFGDFSGSELPQEILDEWVSAVSVGQSPDSILPVVTVSGEYEVDYGPTYSFEGTYVDGEPIVVGITEGCEVELGAPVEHSSEGRVSISSCELDGRVELLISGGIDYIERTRSHEFVRITTNP